MKRRRHDQPDSNVWFNKERGAGVLIMHKMRRCIYFVRGEVIDTLDFTGDDPMTLVDNWIAAKRKHYLALALEPAKAFQSPL